MAINSGSKGWFDWPFDPANSGSVTGWSFWIAVVGLMLTAIGFAVTIYQVKRTRSAADSAEREVKRIERSLNRYEIVNEATRASAALATARNFLRSGLWAHVADNYEVVRGGLEALRADAEDLTDAHRTRIDEASTYIQRLCARIESGIQSGHVNVDAAKTVSVMSDHKMLIAEIIRIIEKGVIR